MAYLLETLNRYAEIAAKDRHDEALAREAREKRADKDRAAMKWQGNIMWFFTIVIAVATAVSAWAACQHR